MRLQKMKLPGSLMIGSVMLFILALNASATTVKVSGRQILVNGEPFTVKGVVYTPVPIGVDPETTPPYGDYFTSDYSAIHNRDLPLLRQMGTNTIRLMGWNDSTDHKDFLDKAYNNGVDPIYVIVTFWMGPSLYPDISSLSARTQIKTDFRTMVAAHKDHPAILMWSIGDELNASWMYGDKLNDLFGLINEMANEAHQEEGADFHPVITSLADIDLIATIANYEPLLTSLDVWGTDIYRGYSFGRFFDDFEAVSAKPLVITGFDIDAYDESADDEYENVGIPYQATYAGSLWQEISANSEVCSGGIIRAYSDEWWLGKTGNTLGGCPDLDPAFHSPCGHLSDSDPDGFINYEWFGIMRAVSPTLTKGGEGGFPIDIMEPRAVYSSLKRLWAIGRATPLDNPIWFPTVNSGETLQSFISGANETGIGWFDGFEGYPAGQFPSPPWSYSGNSNIVVDNTVSLSGNQSVRLYGSVGGCWGGLLHRELNVSLPFTIDFYVRNGSENLSGCHPVRAGLTLNTSPSWTAPGRVLIAFDGDSSIRGSSESTGGFIDNNNKGVRLGSFPANVWIKVKVTYEKSDPSTVGISYWVDDEFKGKDSLPSLSFENDLVYFSATTGEGTVWFDDIRVTPKSSSAGNGGEGDILYCSCQEGK